MCDQDPSSENTNMFEGKTIDLANITSKLVYREFRSFKQTSAKILSKYPDLSIDWKRLYSLAFETTLDTKVRESQYKLLRAVCCKNRLRVCKIEKSDFLKICQKKGFGELVLRI